MMTPEDKLRAFPEADCHNCPFKLQPCVKPSIRPESSLIVLGEYPGASDVEQNELFSGMPGVFTATMVGKSGHTWGHTHRDTVFLCKPTGDAVPAEISKAATCCHNRLVKSLGSQPRIVLALGRLSVSALTRHTNFMEWVGGPVQGVGDFKHLTTIASPHPAFAMKPGKRCFLQPIARFIVRAGMLANGKLQPWVWPTGFIEPGKETLKALQRLTKADHVAVDVESPGTARSDKLLVLGLGTVQDPIALPWDAYFDEPGLQSTKLGSQCADLAREILANPKVAKVFQNGIYDLTTLRNHDIECTPFSDDLMYMHAIYGPELPHRLGFLLALESCADPYKAIFHIDANVEKRDPVELRVYNTKDIITTDYLYPIMQKRVNARPDTSRLYAQLMELGRLACTLHWDGMQVDQAAKAEHAERLIARKIRARREAIACGKKLGFKRFNPQSRDDLIKLFKLRLHQDLTTTSKDQQDALDKKALTKLLTASGSFTRKLARSILRMRKWASLSTQHIVKLQVDERSIVHPGFKPHAAITGRWSTSAPSLLVVPKALTKRLKDDPKTGEARHKVVYPSLRNIYIPRTPDNYIVKADFKAQELRFIALLAGAQKMLKWFQEEQDVHTVHAKMLFKTDAPSKAERTLIKNFVFNCVPGDTRALTRTGWKTRSQLTIGEDILTYNAVTKCKEWKPLLGIVMKQDQPIVSVQLPTRTFQFRCTPDHNWFVHQAYDSGKPSPNKFYRQDEVRCSTDLTRKSYIIVNAPMTADTSLISNAEIAKQDKYGTDWTRVVCQMSSEQRRAFLTGFMLADGMQHKETKAWSWCQNTGDLADAALTATYLEHPGVCYVAVNDRLKTQAHMTCRLSKKPFITGQRLQVLEAGRADVWCPSTENHSWVARQGNCITITGNCNYLGSAETIHSLLIVTHPTISIAQVRAMIRWYFTLHYEIPAWQHKQMRFAEANDYTEEPFSGRRRYFYGTVEGTEAVNFPVQAGGAHLLNTALLEIKDLLDRSHYEHILVPVHDEIVVEGPDPARLAKLLDLTMAKRLDYNGNWMRFSVDCSVGKNWADCHAELDPYYQAEKWWFWSKGFEKLCGPYADKKTAKEAVKGI